MMFVPLKSIPRYERHLLYCSRLSPRSRRTHHRRGVPHLAAINRSLRVHGDPVSSTWPAVLAAPADSIPS